MQTPEVQSHKWYNQNHHLFGQSHRFTNPWKKQQPINRMATVLFQLANSHKRVQLLTGQPPSFAIHKRLPCMPIYPEQLALPPENLRVYWLGHATALIQANGQTILTDPVLGRQIGPFPTVNVPSYINKTVKQLDQNLLFRAPRQPEIALPAKQLPSIDVVLLSHNHYDHLDKPSILQLESQSAPLFIVPLGVSRYLRRWGIQRIVELDWWQFISYQNIRYHCTPAYHDSQRKWNDRGQTLWSGWFVETQQGQSQTLFFAGDTAYAPHFKEIHNYLGAPSFALLPIGAYLPRSHLGHVHIDPEEALQAFDDLQAQKLVAIHWGTFDLGEEPILRPGQLLMELAQQKKVDLNKIAILPVGGKVTLA